MEINRVIGTAELCRTLNVKRSKLFLMFRCGELTRVKVGTKSGALASEVNRYLKSLTEDNKRAA
jgi:hypothetical protein